MMMSVHASPSKRRARPTGWDAQVSPCSFVCEWGNVFIAQIYHIFSIKDNILGNRVFLKYTYFHKESIEWKELEQDRPFPSHTDSSYFVCRGDNDMTMHIEAEVGESFAKIR